jgi:hypothetical protein
LAMSMAGLCQTNSRRDLHAEPANSRPPESLVNQNRAGKLDALPRSRITCEGINGERLEQSYIVLHTIDQSAGARTELGQEYRGVPGST